MKQYKLDIINEMDKMSNDLREISLQEAAKAVGINHLQRQECVEIGRAFEKTHPDYRMVKMINPKYREDAQSLFTTLVLTSLEYED